MKHTCKFCDKELENCTQYPNNSVKIECPNCGTYKISHSFKAFAGIKKDVISLQSKENPRHYDEYPLHEVKGAIFELNSREVTPLITWEELNEGLTIKNLLKSVSIPKTPMEKINKLLLRLGKPDKVGKRFSLNNPKHPLICYSKNVDEFHFIVNAAESLGYIEGLSMSTAGPAFVISLAGWERIEQLQVGNKNSKQGFIACYFGESQSKYAETIVEGVKEAGYEPMLLKYKNYPETVISKAFAEIKRSRFIVVDLTEQRKSVFFEAGYALGIGIDTILVIEKKYWQNHQGDLEFYVKNYNIKMYEDEVQLKEIVKTAIAERID